MASLARGLVQRLGRLDPEVARLGGRSPIWLHAASVGEVLSAEPLVERLRRDEPGHPLLVTTTSLTGRETARSRLGVPATLLPLDLPPLTGRIMRQLAPAALVILETEIWPSLLGAAARCGVPVLFVSARLSARAAARYGRVRSLFSGVLARVSAVSAQTQADADRFVALGAPREKVQVSGSLKLARLPSPDAKPRPVELGARPFVVGASTQPGEEQVVLDACAVLRREFADLLLVLAPRRPERFAEVADLLARSGVSSTRRSEGVPSVEADTQVFLLDTVGELSAFLAGASAAFVGGTLAPIGGHNILEPAAYGVPVAFGPHLDNVREAAEMIRTQAGDSEIHDSAQLAAFWRAALTDPEGARLAAQRVRAEMERRSRVADDVAQLVRQHLRRIG